MNTQEKTIARLMFKNKILQAKGQQFENLFVLVMGYARTDFRPIKPQGKFGDRKNDGCEPSVGRYYQVYAPEDATTKESASVKKIKADFAGLKAYWAKLFVVGIQEFYFVLNDRYDGSFPTTLAALSVIKTENSLSTADVFLCKNLERIVFDELSDDQIQVVAGFVPDTSTIVKVDYSILTEVIGHILSSTASKAQPGKLISPKFEAKLVFNALIASSPYLKAGSYQSGAVDSFFEKNVNFARQAVRESLNNFYIEATEQKFEADTMAGLTIQDKMFFHILSSATPLSGIGGAAPVQQAVLVLLAYFFESCDIFEDVK